MQSALQLDLVPSASSQNHQAAFFRLNNMCRGSSGLLCWGQKVSISSSQGTGGEHGSWITDHATSELFASRM